MTGKDMILKFTNTSSSEFEVKFDGKVVAIVGAGDTIDLPADHAKVGAKALANKVCGERGNFTDFNEKHEAEMKKILGGLEVEKPFETPADSDEGEDYSELTIKELQTALAEKEIEYPKSARKEQLVDLLENPPVADESDGEGDDEGFEGKEE